ncbi:MAG: tRNA 2-selenouridine(34) synthase MnmH [Planctomycetota bacterium]
MNRIAAGKVRLDGSSRILDVRSPGEFATGHIPGARSLPLFSDEERAVVGTLYKQVGKEEATRKGLEIGGSKMRELVEKAAALAPDRRVTIHCWRGGQRSAAIGWLLDFAGFEVRIIEGGYKGWRSAAHNVLNDSSLQLIVLGGGTGCGKTEVLQALREAGEQIIDLEALANHKGSAFGWIDEQKQPTTEQFENNLFLELFELDRSKRIWVENESRRIGNVYVPEHLHRLARHSPLINLIVDDGERIERLVRLYAKCPDELQDSFKGIAKRLGGGKLNEALASIENGDFETAAGIALQYYDKTYQYGLENTEAATVIDLNARSLSAAEIASRLIETVKSSLPLPA